MRLNRQSKNEQQQLNLCRPRRRSNVVRPNQPRRAKTTVMTTKSQLQGLRRDDVLLDLCAGALKVNSDQNTSAKGVGCSYITMYRDVQTLWMTTRFSARTGRAAAKGRRREKPKKGKADKTEGKPPAVAAAVVHSADDTSEGGDNNNDNNNNDHNGKDFMEIEHAQKKRRWIR